jgi:hypothetical protein
MSANRVRSIGPSEKSLMIAEPCPEVVGDIFLLRQYKNRDRHENCPGAVAAKQALGGLSRFDHESVESFARTRLAERSRQCICSHLSAHGQWLIFC